MERIAGHPVVEIPRNRVIVNFYFDGKELSGYDGEALSSALVAAGVTRFSLHPRDGRPQGIFCANGQCSQCTAIVDGMARKACVTPLRAGMDVRTLTGLPVLPADDKPAGHMEKRRLSADILVIGGGPSGLSAAVELSRMGLSVIVADDKASLGGKLVLQTHKFFGSQDDCYAGTRGFDIAKTLEAQVRSMPNVTILANSPVVGIYKDRKAGIYVDYASYVLVDFTALVVATGARERSIIFPGNDLPGVYGAGAFQTLVNRDLVKAARRVLVVGSGNVGLIAAYHALQAGIEVAAIVEILGKVNGYKVHADKIVRAGVPVYLSTTVLAVEGEGRVQRAVVAAVGKDFKPIPETTRVYEVDTVLVAAGLSPCDEFYRQARDFGFLAVSAGDAEEIAEASSAMFGGRIAALSLGKLLGYKVEIDPSWIAKREVLKSRPGEIIVRDSEKPGSSWRPVFFCTEEIPCNPCTSVCPTHSIRLRARKGNILDLPYYQGTDCRGCMACVAICPGLAVSMVRRIDEDWTEVVLPYEFPAEFAAGTKLALLDTDGAFLEEAELLRKVWNRKNKTWLLTFQVTGPNATKAIGIRVQRPEATEPSRECAYSALSDEAIVCRCEHISVGEMVAFIRENRIRDANQLKTLRAGMGSCGSKTCSVLLPQVFRKAGVDPAEVAGLTLRPVNMETGFSALVNEGRETRIEADASQRGAP